MGRILVFGHRGIRALYPENTMRSFIKAAEAGVDGIETDVHMTTDGRLVLIHDGKLDRTVNSTGDVESFTFAELRKLTASKAAEDEGADDVKIPELCELLELAKEKDLLLNVEIKDYREEVVDKTVAELEKRGFTDRYVIASFCPRITTYAHTKYGVKTQGFPLSYMSGWDENTESHYYSVGIGMKDLTAELCADYKAKGIDPWCWCPDDEASVIKAEACNSTLVTCNNVKAAIERFGKKHGKSEKLINKYNNR